MKTFRTLDLFDPTVVIGRHSIWLPQLQIKVPFQHAGRIAKYTRPEQTTSDPWETLPHEVAILRALADLEMAPPVGDFVYFGEVVSSYPRGAWWCDPLGAYGYEIGDATRLPPGRFSIDAMRRLPIQGSEGAWNDLLKDGNVVNGYLIDARRTDWDMLKWTGELPEMSRVREDPEALRERVVRLCSFPKGERPEAYQEFYLDGLWIHGSRSVTERAARLGFEPRWGQSVLDVGCQSGGFLQLAALAGATGLFGAEIDRDYIECARALARRAGHNICVRETDASRPEPLVEWMRAHGAHGEALDHCLILSMEKHIGEEALWRIVDGLKAKRTYLETSAQQEGAYRLRADVEKRGGRYLGDSHDRSTRRLYRIDRT